MRRAWLYIRSTLAFAWVLHWSGVIFLRLLEPSDNDCRLWRFGGSDWMIALRRFPHL